MNVKAVWKRWLDRTDPTPLQIHRRRIAAQQASQPQPLPVRKTAKQRLLDFIAYQKYLKLKKDPNYRPVQGYANTQEVRDRDHHLPPPPRP